MKNNNTSINIEKLKEGVFFASRGGGVRSSVSIGVLRALEEENIPVKGISGESLGSIFASLFAYGYNSDEIMKLFLEYNSILTRAAKIFGGRGSIVIEEEVNKVTNNILFKDLKIDCYINSCTGKLLNPSLVLFSKEETPNETLGSACRASASLPILFGNCTKTINGKEYSLFDGGFLYNPYIPSTDYPIVYASFHNYIDYYKLIPRAKKIIDKSNNVADLIIYAPVGKTLVTGSNDDMIRMADMGYTKTKKLLKSI